MHRFLGLHFHCFLLPFFMDAGVIGKKHPRNGDCISDPLHLPNPTVLTELSSLPASYAAASLPQDPTVQLQIHNTLALYPLSIDSKNYTALSRVFTCDVVANYSAPLNVVTGLSHLQAVLSESLFYVSTQHSFATQVIDVFDGGREAKSLTYFTATHFGQGDFYGQATNIPCPRQALYAHGQYQDTWERKNDEWRVKVRNLVYMGTFIGNQSIFAPSHDT